MQGLNLPLKHHSIITAELINEICKPLFDHSEIKAFLYGHVQFNGTVFCLTSHAKWHHFHLQKGYQITPPVPEISVKQNMYFIPCYNDKHMPFNKALYDMRSLFSLDFPLFLIDNIKGGYELYAFFSTVANQQAINFYLNHLPILQKFKFYFKDKARDLIKEAKKHSFIIPADMQPNTIITKESTEIAKLDKMLEPNEYHLGERFNNAILSPREFSCVKNLCHGNAPKEIARLLNISPRTVETHISHAKIKLGLYRNTDLIKIFSKIV